LPPPGVFTSTESPGFLPIKAREKAKANPHTEEAIKHLNQAIDEDKNGHADIATTPAEAALTHLEKVE
jgi:Small metal-binding protein